MRDLNKNLVEKLKEKAAEAVRERPSLSKIEHCNNHSFLLKFRKA